MSRGKERGLWSTAEDFFPPTARTDHRSDDAPDGAHSKVALPGVGAAGGAGGSFSAAAHVGPVAHGGGAPGTASSRLRSISLQEWQMHSAEPEEAHRGGGGGGAQVTAGNFRPVSSSGDRSVWAAAEDVLSVAARPSRPKKQHKVICLTRALPRSTQTSFFLTTLRSLY